jgi:hypothetical protein
LKRIHGANLAEPNCRPPRRVIHQSNVATRLEQPVSYEDTEKRIRDIAYRIWLQEGQPQGLVEAHWEERG